MTHRYSLLRAFAPLAVTAVLACTLFVGSLLVGAHDVDRAETERQQMLVASDVSRRLAEIESSLNPFVIWDEAVQHLSTPVDTAWADKNIGRSITVNLKFERLVVVDRADLPVYAFGVKGPPSASAIAELTRLSAPLVAQVRRAEASPQLRAQLHSIQASALRIADASPVILTASLVRPEANAAAAQGPAPILVTQVPVQEGLLEPLVQRFHLTDAQVVHGSTSPERGAGITLASLSGGDQVRITWASQRPGAELLARSTPFLVLAALAILGTALVLISHMRRVAKSLLRSRERASHLAFHDPLTGLANRALLSERLEATRQAMRRGGAGYAVLCLDLDRFKEVNDIYGHAAGDELIREVAARLQQECRDGDTIARLGGDEFAVVMASTSPTGAATLASRIVEQISGAVELKSGRAILSCSVGVSAISDSAIDPLDALRQADLALYRAKAHGKGRFCFFESEMDAAVKSKKTLEDDLRAALAQGDLFVAYQPIVHENGELVALEALARWNDPVRGNVPPSVFIPVAEEAGLITAVGEFMFRRACEDSLLWPGVRLSVNVSPVQIRRPGMIEQIQQILDETGADASRFDLEITEGCLLQDDDRTHDVLARLRAIGFGFSLDDFGTGYSSLSYLHRYPVQKIKLDRSFISRLSDGPQGGLIVASLILLARALDLKVIAEGVETRDQLEQLVDFGCGQFQGYLFSRPIGANEVSDRVSRRTLFGQAA